jgi:hypothetical protein
MNEREHVHRYNLSSEDLRSAYCSQTQFPRIAHHRAVSSPRLFLRLFVMHARI